MKIKSPKDFFSGLLFVLFGAAFAWGSTTYRVGTSASMGPGYFPLLLGLVLAFLGLVILLRSLVWQGLNSVTETDRVGAWAFRPLFFIIAANVLFGVLLGGLPRLGLPAAGLVLAIYGLTVVAGLAGDRFSLKQSLLLATVLSAGSYLAFVVWLRLQLLVWPAFLSA